MLTLLLGTGLRVSECVGLNINDVDLDACGVRIFRKGGKESIVYFSDEVRDVLETYLDERQAIDALPGHEDAVFLSLQKKRMSVRTVENMVKKYAGLVTPLKKITPHKLRSIYGHQPLPGNRRYLSGSIGPWAQRCQYHQEALCSPGGPETEKRQKYSPAKGEKGTGAPVAWLVQIQTGCGLEPASYKRHSLIISYPAADPENYCSDGIIPGCLA